MLGYLIPDSLQRLFVEFVVGLPIVMQQTVFVLFCVGFVLIISRILRWLLLCLDVELALRSQRAQQTVGRAAEVAGHTAIWQWHTLLAICVLTICSTIMFSGMRAAQVDPENAAYGFARTLQICLSPNSGNGDTLARCLAS